jgi:hypothetical protein
MESLDSYYPLAAPVRGFAPGARAKEKEVVNVVVAVVAVVVVVERSSPEGRVERRQS